MKIRIESSPVTPADFPATDLLPGHVGIVTQSYYGREGEPVIGGGSRNVVFPGGRMPGWSSSLSESGLGSTSHTRCRELMPGEKLVSDAKGTRIEGPPQIADMPVTDLGFGEIGVLTKVPSFYNSRPGEIVVRAGTQFAFPDRAMWGSSGDGCRCRRLQPGECIIVEA